MVLTRSQRRKTPIKAAIASEEKNDTLSSSSSSHEENEGEVRRHHTHFNKKAISKTNLVIGFAISTIVTVISTLSLSLSHHPR